jgi:hypothetical protein
VRYWHWARSAADPANTQRWKFDGRRRCLWRMLEDRSLILSVIPLGRYQPQAWLPRRAGVIGPASTPDSLSDKRSHITCRPALQPPSAPRSPCLAPTILIPVLTFGPQLVSCPRLGWSRLVGLPYQARPADSLPHGQSRALNRPPRPHRRLTVLVRMGLGLPRPCELPSGCPQKHTPAQGQPSAIH